MCTTAFNGHAADCRWAAQTALEAVGRTHPVAIAVVDRLACIMCDESLQNGALVLVRFAGGARSVSLVIDDVSQKRPRVELSDRYDPDSYIDQALTSRFALRTSVAYR